MATTIVSNQADELNAKYEALGKRFDSFFSQISKSHKNTIQKVLSDWQDFYYSDENYGNNPNVTIWQRLLTTTSSLLEKAISERHLKPKVAKEAKVISTIVVEEPTVVFGRFNIKTLFGLLVGGAAIGFIGYNSFKKK